MFDTPKWKLQGSWAQSFAGLIDVEEVRKTSKCASRQALVLLGSQRRTVA
jgi:hypothetical protein